MKKTIGVFGRDRNTIIRSVENMMAADLIDEYEERRIVLTNRGLNSFIDNYDNFVDLMDDTDCFAFGSSDIRWMDTKQNMELFSNTVEKLRPDRNSLMFFYINITGDGFGKPVQENIA